MKREKKFLSKKGKFSRIAIIIKAAMGPFFHLFSTHEDNTITVRSSKYEVIFKMDLCCLKKKIKKIVKIIETFYTIKMVVLVIINDSYLFPPKTTKQ